MPQNMKSIVFSFSFVLISLVVQAQQIKPATLTHTTENIVITNDDTTILATIADAKTVQNTSVAMDKVCYGELSKIAFYETLISQNNLNIHLKNSTDLAIKSTEEIISKKRNQVLYTESE